MKTKANKEGLPVSQRQIAQYLGISPTMMSLSGKSHRKLPSNASKKLTALEKDFAMPQKARKQGESLIELQMYDDIKCSEIADKMMLDIDYFDAKAKVLQSKLDTMIISYDQDSRWLNIVDARLAALPGGRKGAETDWLWLSDQQARVSKRLLKNDISAQLKLEQEIEMAKATVLVNKALYKKLRIRANKK